MSDDPFWSRPDLRQLPEHVKQNIKAKTPFREGEVLAKVVLHSSSYKGKSIPHGRVQPELFVEDGKKPGILISFYDHTGVHTLVTTQIHGLERSTKFIHGVLDAYEAAGGTLDTIIKERNSDE